MSDEEPRLAPLPPAPVDAARPGHWHPVVSELQKARGNGSSASATTKRAPQRPSGASSGAEERSPLATPPDGRPALLRALVELFE